MARLDLKSHNKEFKDSFGPFIIYIFTNASLESLSVI